MEDIYGKVENLNSASKLTKDAMSEVGSGTTETANAVQTLSLIHICRAMETSVGLGL